MLSPDQVAEKWARNAAQAGESVKAGVMAVTVNPAERAKAQSNAYLAGVQRALSSGKYERGLNRVTLEGWKQAMLNKGVPRIAQGVSEAKPKMAQFLARWLPHQQALKSKLQSMPRGDLEQNIQRAITAMRHNADFKYSG